MFVYECAACAMLFQTSFVGWASFQGRRLLDIPGTKLFVWHKGLGELYNVSPNLVMAYRVGAAVVLLFVLGLVFGAVVQLLGCRSRKEKVTLSPGSPGGGAPARGQAPEPSGETGAREESSEVRGPSPVAGSALPPSGRATRPSNLAMASAVLAVAGIFAFGFATGFLAVVLGTIAAGQIRRNAGLTGRLWARTGQIIGGLDVIVWTIAMEYLVRL
jgi:hypothetical protein